MDEEYKQSDISKVVEQLMDEEGYEFGEAVKKAMEMGYRDGGLMVAIQKFNQGGNVIDSRATTQDFTNALRKVSAGTTYQQQADAKRYARNQANQMLTNTMRSGNQANIQNLLQQVGGITSIPGMQFNRSGNSVTSIPATGSGRDKILDAMANQMLSTTSYGGSGGVGAPRQKSALELKIEENKRLFDNYTKNNPATIDPAAALGGPGLMKTGAQLNTGTSIPEPAYMNKDLLSQLTMLTPEEAFAGETFDTLSDLDQYNFAQAFTQFQPQLRDSSYVSPYGPPGDQQIFNRRYGIRDGGMAGGKTYHQFHDQYVPIDEESMGYAYGGGVGSMMQPRQNFAVGGGADYFQPLGYDEDESITVEDFSESFSPPMYRPVRSVGGVKLKEMPAGVDQSGIISAATNIMSPGVNTIEGSLIDGDDPSSRYAVQQDFKSDRPFDRDFSEFDKARMGQQDLEITDRNRGQIIERAPSTPFDRGITMADIAGPSTIDRFSNSVGPVPNVEATYQDMVMNPEGFPNALQNLERFQNNRFEDLDFQPGYDFKDARNKVSNLKELYQNRNYLNNPNSGPFGKDLGLSLKDGITNITDYAKENLTPKNIATSVAGGKIASVFGLPAVLGSFLARSLFGKKEDEFEGPFDDINNDGVIDRFDRARTTFGQSKTLKEYFEKVKEIKAQKEIKRQEEAERNRAETAAIQARVDRQYRDQMNRDGRDFSVSGPDTSANPTGKSNQASSERGYALHGAKGGIVPNGLSRKMTR